MNDLISRKALLAEYDRVHIGEPGKARKLIEDAPAVREWIPVSERLPESGIEVLAMLQVNRFDGHNAHNVVTAVRMPSDSWLVADYQEGIEAEIFGADFEDCRYWITHWMPLPEPPKGE